MKEKNLFYAARNLALVFLAILYFKYSLPLMETWKQSDGGMGILIAVQAVLYFIAIGMYLWHENDIKSPEILTAKLLFLTSFTISVCLSVNVSWYWLLIPGGFEAFGVLEERKVVNFFKKQEAL